MKQGLEVKNEKAGTTPLEPLPFLI